jgi:hypothetical protein
MGRIGDVVILMCVIAMMRMKDSAPTRLYFHSMFLEMFRVSEGAPDALVCRPWRRRPGNP